MLASRLKQWDDAAREYGALRLGDRKVALCRRIWIIGFNCARANPARARLILQQLPLLSKRNKNTVIMIQECKRWALKLQGQAFGQHMFFASKFSDCGILVPSSLLSEVVGISSGPRQFVVSGNSFNLVCGHLIWEKGISGDLEAFDTMNDISTYISEVSRRSKPISLAMDANISVSKFFPASHFDAGSEIREVETYVAGDGIMRSSKKHNQFWQKSFLNWCDSLGIVLTNTFLTDIRKDAYTWKKHRSDVNLGLISQIDYIGLSKGIPFKCSIPDTHVEHRAVVVSPERKHMQGKNSPYRYSQLRTSDHRPIAVSFELPENFRFFTEAKNENGKGWEPLNLRNEIKYRMETSIAFGDFDTLQLSVLEATKKMDYSTSNSRKQLWEMSSLWRSIGT